MALVDQVGPKLSDISQVDARENKYAAGLNRAIVLLSDTVQCGQVGLSLGRGGMCDKSLFNPDRQPIQ